MNVFALHCGLIQSVAMEATMLRLIYRHRVSGQMLFSKATQWGTKKDEGRDQKSSAGRR